MFDEFNDQSLLVGEVEALFSCRRKGEASDYDRFVVLAIICRKDAVGVESLRASRDKGLGVDPLAVFSELVHRVPEETTDGHSVLIGCVEFFRVDHAVCVEIQHSLSKLL